MPREAPVRNAEVVRHGVPWKGVASGRPSEVGVADKLQAAFTDRVCEGQNGWRAAAGARPSPWTSGVAYRGSPRIGMPERLQVHAQLVRATGFGFQLQPGCAAVWVAGSDPPARGAGFAPLVVDFSAGAAWASRRRWADRSRPSPARVAPAHRPPSPHSASAPVRSAKAWLRARWAGPEPRANSIRPQVAIIQPVDHQGIRVRRLYPRTQAILFVWTASGYGQHAGWLVHHQQIIVLMDDDQLSGWHHDPVAAAAPCRTASSTSLGSCNQGARAFGDGVFARSRQ